MTARCSERRPICEGDPLVGNLGTRDGPFNIVHILRDVNEMNTNVLFEDAVVPCFENPVRVIKPKKLPYERRARGG